MATNENQRETGEVRETRGEEGGCNALSETRLPHDQQTPQKINK